MTRPLWTLGRPHPEHRANVVRQRTGISPLGGQRYATGVRCSCGTSVRVSNEAPSKGGQAVARRWYLEHLAVQGVQDVESGWLA